MEKPDPKLLANAADALGINYPALVEKDYYAVQLLKLIGQVNVPEYKMDQGLSFSKNPKWSNDRSYALLS